LYIGWASWGWIGSCLEPNSTLSGAQPLTDQQPPRSSAQL